MLFPIMKETDEEDSFGAQPTFSFAWTVNWRQEKSCFCIETDKVQGCSLGIERIGLEVRFCMSWSRLGPEAELLTKR